MKIIQGNLFKDKNLTVIAHGCNCFNTMGSGIAKTIKILYPEVYETDCKTIKGSREKLGTISWTIIDDSLKIANCYTQFTYWDPNDRLHYWAVEDCFKQLHDATTEKDIIGMPKIGCGLAGGNWDVVKTLIEKYLSDRTVYVFYF